jgi:hypothetical protein
VPKNSCGDRRPAAKNTPTIGRVVAIPSATPKARIIHSRCCAMRIDGHRCPGTFSDFFRRISWETHRRPRRHRVKVPDYNAFFLRHTPHLDMEISPGDGHNMLPGRCKGGRIASGWICGEECLCNSVNQKVRRLKTPQHQCAVESHTFLRRLATGQDRSRTALDLAD